MRLQSVVFHRTLGQSIEHEAKCRLISYIGSYNCCQCSLTGVLLSHLRCLNIVRIVNLLPLKKHRAKLLICMEGVQAG